MNQDLGSGFDVDLEKILMELLPAAVCIVDSSGRIMRYNRRAAELWGREPRLSDLEKFTGAFRLFRPDGSEIRNDLTPVAMALREGRAVRDVPIIIEQPGGRRLDALVTVVPWMDARGQQAGAVSCIFEVTTLREAEAEERRLKDELEERVFLRTRELARRMEQQSALADLARDVLVVASEESFLETLCGGARAALDARAAVSWLKPESGTHELLAKASPSLKLWPGQPHPDPAALGRAIFKDPALLERPRRLAREEEDILGLTDSGWHAQTQAPPQSFIIPIRADRGRLVGFILLAGKEAGSFPPGDEAIALQVSRIASIAWGRLRAERSTAASRAELQEFSYAVAHNFRAPLRAVSGLSAILTEDYKERVLDESGQRLLARMRDAAFRMDSLIQALLSYTRLTYEEFPLEPLSLGELVRDALQRTREGKSDGVAIQVETVSFTVLGHRFLLEEAIRHLLENAFKFTRPECAPSVLVRGEERGDRVRLWIEDHGPGIHRQHLERIFSLFELLQPAAAASGVGIGLPIVRKAVERMRGRFGVESEVGIGSKFWIELRRSPQRE